MKYTDKKETPLKWHRTVQFLVLPLLTVYSLYRLISLVSELLNLKFTWTMQWITDVLALLGTDVFHLGSYFWPVVGVLAFMIMQTVLALFAWFGSFRWRKYSLVCWILFSLFELVKTAGGCWLIETAGIQKGLIATAAPYLSNRFGRIITVNDTTYVLLRVLMVILLLCLLAFFVCNAIYYIKRRGLFRRAASLQEPYHDPGFVPEPVSEPAPEPEPVTVQPVPDNSWTCPVCGTRNDKMFCSECGHPKDAPVPAETADPVPVEADPDDRMLNETMVIDTIVDDAIRAEKLANIEADPDDRMINETQVINTIVEEEARKQEQSKVRLYCPECGARLSEHDVVFCTKCGHRLKEF